MEVDSTTMPSNNETTTAGITSTLDEETTTADGEKSTTPAGETTPDPVSTVYCNHFIKHRINHLTSFSVH